METWKYIREILILPVAELIVIPGVILWLTGPDTFGVWQSVPASRLGLPILGSLIICLGFALLVATIRQFVKAKTGTLAPWRISQRLVVWGVYRHVRNPMMTGVLFIILGEAILTASAPLLIWFLVFGGVTEVFIRLIEEPALRTQFGSDYLTYKQNVPRWIPRLRAWTPLGSDAETNSERQC